MMGFAMRLTHENRRKLGATVIAAVLMALGPVLMTQSKVDGEYPYSVPVCNLLAEIMKLCISATFLAVSHGLCREPSAEPPAPQHGHTCLGHAVAVLAPSGPEGHPLGQGCPMDSPRRMAAEERLRRCASPARESPDPTAFDHPGAAAA